MLKNPPLKVEHPLAIPEELHGDRITLRFAEYVPADEEEGLVPKYVFTILDADRNDVGHVSFKVGDTWHVMFAVGHVGYLVKREHRGHGYAYRACRALAPFIKTLYESVIITTNPANAASIRTIERLGGEFRGEVDIPDTDPSFSPADARRKRYEWHL